MFEFFKVWECFKFEYLIRVDNLVMDLLASFFSIVKDFSEQDNEFKRLNFQLTYGIQRANLLIKRVESTSSDADFILKNVQRTIGQALQLQQRLEKLLNAENIAMKDKIRLSLPFDQTKKNIQAVIEDLEKGCNDLKEELNQETRPEETRGVKRRVSERTKRNIQKLSGSKSLIRLDLEQPMENLSEMCPTIQENQVNFSDLKSKKEYYIEIHIELMGNPELVRIVQRQQPQLASKKIKIKLQSMQKTQVIYTAARLKFKKIYNRLKKISKDIDRISKDAHFHILCTLDPKQQENQIRLPSTAKKNRDSQDEDVFFSFPKETFSTLYSSCRVIMKKQDEKKLVYQFRSTKWQKIQEKQMEVLNGDLLAAFVNPESKQPSLYFKISYRFE